MSKRHFLDFESPIAELESKIDELRYVQNESAVDISDEIERLSQKSQQLTRDIYASLTPWQVTQIARHPQRPYTLDYVNEVFTDFQELHGDRHYADDLSIVGGLARFNGQACMVLGHQKGRDTKERTQMCIRDSLSATTSAPGRSPRDSRSRMSSAGPARQVPASALRASASNQVRTERRSGMVQGRPRRAAAAAPLY